MDEAQDLSDAQIEIVGACRESGVRVTLVGDLMQAIYGFQRSSPQHMQNFMNRLSEGQKISLRRNYRSTNSSIVTLANAIAFVDIRDDLAVDMQSTGRPGPKPTLLITNNAVRAAAEHVVQLRTNYQGDSVVVLAHTNAEARAIHTELLKREVHSVLNNSTNDREIRPIHASQRDAVECCTIHGKKGGEADHVILLSATDRGDYKEELYGCESKRLLYTAVTRARRTLWMASNDAGVACRWLKGCEAVLHIVGDVSFPTTVIDPAIPTKIGVVDMLRMGGARGLHNFFAQQFSPDSLYETAQVAMGGSGDKKLSLPAVVRKFNMEAFAGHLVELTALHYLGKDLVLKALRSSWEHANKLFVNEALLEVFAKPGWWPAHGERLVTQMLRSLEGEDLEEWYLDWSREGSEGFCNLLKRALSQKSIWFKLQSRRRVELFIHFCNRVDWRQSHEVIFRKYAEWDDQRSEAMIETYAAALEHVEALMRGDSMSDDRWRDAMAYGAALLCINDAEHAPDCEALVRLSQPASRNGIELKELRLDSDLEEALRKDAAYLQEKYGPAVAANNGVVLQYSCMSDYGDKELAAQGTVVGRYDAVLQGAHEASLLEIKAVKDVQCSHAAQALMYSEMYQGDVEKVLLWDTRGRRVFEWELGRSRRHELARSCIACYVESGDGNIPGVRGRVVPQMVRVDT